KFEVRSSKPRVSGYIASVPEYHPTRLDTMPVMRFNNDPTAIVYIPDGDDLSVRINVLNVPSNKHGSGSIEFLDMNGDQLDNFMFSNENRNWNSITFTAPEGNKFYKLKFSNPSSWMSIQGPNRPDRKS